MQPGYKLTIKAGGTSTADVMSATRLVANTVYQIGVPAKRLLDPTVAVVVEVDADGSGGLGGYAVADPSTYTVDFLFGKITFAADQGASAEVKVTANYLTPITVGEAKSAEITLEQQLEDATTYPECTDGYRRKKATLKDCSGSLTSLKVLQTDHDEGAGTLKFTDHFLNGTSLLIEVGFVGGNTADEKFFRAWALLDTLAEGFTPEGLYEGTVSWVATTIATNNQTERALYGFGG